MTVQDIVARQTGEVEVAQPMTVRDSLALMKDKFDLALPSETGFTTEEFMASAATVIQYDPKLMEIMADPERRGSIYGALYTAAQLGLSPSKVLGQVWFIPRKDYRLKKNLCTFMLGYKGLLTLIRRTENVGAVMIGHAFNDEIQMDEMGMKAGVLTTDFVIKERADRPLLPDSPPTIPTEFQKSPNAASDWVFENLDDWDPEVTFYALIEIHDGTGIVKKLSARAALAHYLRTHPAASGSTNGSGRYSTAWDGHYAQMAAISALRVNAGTLEKSTSLERALSNEMTVRTNLELDAIDVPVRVVAETEPLEALMRTSDNGASIEAIRLVESFGSDEIGDVLAYVDDLGDSIDVAESVSLAHVVDILCAHLQCKPAGLLNRFGQGDVQEPIVLPAAKAQDLRDFCAAMDIEHASAWQKPRLLSAIAEFYNVTKVEAEHHVVSWLT